MDTKKLLETLTKNPAASAAMGGLAGSLLGNVLTGRGGGGGKKLVKYGGLAAIGYVAYQAWQKNQAHKAGGQTGGVAPMPGAGGVAGGAATPAAGGLAGMLQSVLGGGTAGAGAAAPQLPASFDLESPANAGNALRVVQAMIAASKADGIVDAEERDRIYTKINESGLSTADRAQVEQLLAQPADVDAVVRGVTSKELATEIYAASLIACAPASRAERAYLDMLAARLNLEPGLTMELDRSVELLQQKA
jgi:uncharacterized membrane protein YebE (DUF533 family)